MHGIIEVEDVCVVIDEDEMGADYGEPEEPEKLARKARVALSPVLKERMAMWSGGGPALADTCMREYCQLRCGI